MGERPYPVRLYRPWSGTEGIAFQGAWCARCKHDKAWNGEKSLDECDDADLCQLIARAMAFHVDEPGYPQEWVYRQDGQPACLAFEPTGKPERCALTVDMFNFGKPWPS